VDGLLLGSNRVGTAPNPPLSGVASDSASDSLRDYPISRLRLQLEQHIDRSKRSELSKPPIYADGKVPGRPTARGTGLV
jgi:hypothetical protein